MYKGHMDTKPKGVDLRKGGGMGGVEGLGGGESGDNWA